ncbi:MAG: ATP-binding protein [Dehalococcoidia bacterium]|nr:ATP-binding protein [Dehalococcoidia bacterium]
MTDEARVRRAVLNLVSKAANSMPDGGELTITTDEADGRWQLSVADIGPGIPRNIRSQVFVPFVNLGTDSETGLGLVIAKEVVEGHGGNLSFETRVLGEVEV